GLPGFCIFWAIADTQEKEVRAMVGSDVELSCTCPEGSRFDLNDVYVYWQTSESKTVVTYHIPQNSSLANVDSRYRNRALMSPAGMRRGDFSLRLFNVTPQDEQKFLCLVLSQSLGFQEVLSVEVTLHVAANFSVPIVSAPHSPSQDELTFTCTSINGYPRPNVYWINKTDNSLLDQALQNDTVFLNPRGLYDVVSVLRITRTPSVNIGCCIENVLLQQNLTVGSQTGNDIGERDKITENPVSTGEKNVATWSILAVLCLLVVVAVAIGWVCRDRCLQHSYAGAWAVSPETELTGEFAVGSSRFWGAQGRLGCQLSFRVSKNFQKAKVPCLEQLFPRWCARHFLQPPLGMGWHPGVHFLTLRWDFPNMHRSRETSARPLCSPVPSPDQGVQSGSRHWRPAPMGCPERVQAPAPSPHGVSGVGPGTGAQPPWGVRTGSGHRQLLSVAATPAVCPSVPGAT
uniref:ICOS ligand n=1 Tax=Gorilla gorilla gorilla TaxID=9595 RepID=G3R9N8_GORGO